MVFTPTASLGRALRRLALTTKQAGKDYYKGTGSGSMGRHTKYGGYRIDWDKVRTYKVPNLTDFHVCLVSCTLPSPPSNTPTVEAVCRPEHRQAHKEPRIRCLGHWQNVSRSMEDPGRRHLSILCSFNLPLFYYILPGFITIPMDCIFRLPVHYTFSFSGESYNSPNASSQCSTNECLCCYVLCWLCIFVSVPQMNDQHPVSVQRLMNQNLTSNLKASNVRGLYADGSLYFPPVVPLLNPFRRLTAWPLQLVTRPSLPNNSNTKSN
jgi:hypothetical protein